MENDLSRKIAVDIFNAAIQAVDPYELVKGYAESISAAYHKEHCNKLYLVSFGKAAFAMTKALAESSIRDIITKGIVITKYGHVQGALTGNIEIFEAGHPVPDAKGLAAAKHVMDMLKNGDSQTLVLCLISGGGSALLVAPCNNIALNEKQRVTELLLKAGADINELNTVRKHISAIKGGRLAEIAYPSKVISLILSDVIGDPLDVIASGPTSPDETTYQDAIHVIKKYGLRDSIPEHILHILTKGSDGNVMETPKRGHPVFERVENIIIGSNKVATGAAAKKAIESGFETTILTSELQGDAREAAKWLAGKAIEARGQRLEVIKAGFEGSGVQGVKGQVAAGFPACPSALADRSLRTDNRQLKTEDRRLKTEDRRICLVSGGETTVTVQGDGIGGRNMELALAFALEIAGTDGITLLSAGTDGTDGPTDAAGAVVDGQTINEASAKGLDPLVYLEHNDSYTFFKNTGEFLVTGSTGTNVMDIQIIILT